MKQFVLAALVSMVGVAATPALARDAHANGSRSDHPAATSSSNDYNEDIGLSKGYNRPFAASPAVSNEIAQESQARRAAMAAPETSGKALQQRLVQGGDYTVINNTVDGQFGP